MEGFVGLLWRRDDGAETDGSIRWEGRGGVRKYVDFGDDFFNDIFGTWCAAAQTLRYDYDM